jgi:hypothetical protein
MATIKPVAPATSGARRRLRPIRKHVVEDPAHPRSASIPIAVGASTGELLTTLAAEWQAGRVADLPARLRDVDQLIDALQHQRPRGRMDEQRSGGSRLDEVPA